MKDTLERLRSVLPYRAVAGGPGPHRHYKFPRKRKGIPIWMTGGLGDVLLALPVAESIQEYVGEPVTIFTRFTDVIPALTTLKVVHQDDIIHNGAEWWLLINTSSSFGINPKFKGFENPKVRELYLNWRGFVSVKDWFMIQHNQPLMENLMGRNAVAMGINREALPFAMLGLPCKPKKLTIDQTMNVLPGPYITIHHGFDTSNKHVKGRATKNWSLTSWMECLRRIKHYNRDAFKIVQIGSEDAPDIPYADFHANGKFSMLESLQILAGSRLHVDTESGLVHAAKMMGVKSVVMFGPTNLEFFKYDQNLNMAPKFCGDCWWLKVDWLDKCPLGYVAPMCMDSIKPEQVADAVCEELRGLIQ